MIALRVLCAASLLPRAGQILLPRWRIRASPSRVLRGCSYRMICLKHFRLVTVTGRLTGLVTAKRVEFGLQLLTAILITFAAGLVFLQLSVRFGVHYPPHSVSPDRLSGGSVDVRSATH